MASSDDASLLLSTSTASATSPSTTNSNTAVRIAPIRIGNVGARGLLSALSDLASSISGSSHSSSNNNSSRQQRSADSASTGSGGSYGSAAGSYGPRTYNAFGVEIVSQNDEENWAENAKIQNENVVSGMSTSITTASFPSFSTTSATRPPETGDELHSGLYSCFSGVVDGSNGNDSDMLQDGAGLGHPAPPTAACRNPKTGDDPKAEPHDPADGMAQGRWGDAMGSSGRQGTQPGTTARGAVGSGGAPGPQGDGAQGRPQNQTPSGEAGAAAAPARPSDGGPRAHRRLVQCGSNDLGGDGNSLFKGTPADRRLRATAPERGVFSKGRTEGGLRR